MENLILDAGETLNECDYRDHLAPKWKRFVNFLIDFYGIQLLFGFGYGLLIATGLVERPGRLMLILYSWGTIFILYFILELYTGKTLGKLITGTRVVSIEGGNLTATAIFYRTISHLVPFEPFSMFFGYTAWHDDWSDTAVVNNSYNK